MPVHDLTCNQGSHSPNAKQCKGACLPRWLGASNLYPGYFEVHIARLEGLHWHLLLCLPQLLLCLLKQPLSLLEVTFLEELLALCEQILSIIEAVLAALEEVIFEERISSSFTAADFDLLSAPAHTRGQRAELLSSTLKREPKAKMQEPWVQLLCFVPPLQAC